MLKRTIDVVASALGLAVSSVFLLPAMLAIWLYDRHSPIYAGVRVGRGGAPFRMVKLRSMRVRADSSGLLSTAGDDPRITPVGRFVRRWKLDEMLQLWNVLRGEMSLVGPRPQVQPDVDRYSHVERGLLSVRPGVTDLASIVFADEGEILRGAADPDARYNELIRPWKSRLGLLYVRHAGRVGLDLGLIWLTLYSVVDREAALRRVAQVVRELGGGEELAQVAARTQPLRAAPPPGADEPVASRAAE